MRVWLLMLLALSSEVHAEACVVHTQAERLEVKLCQENRSIPPTLFREGFCQPQIQGQKVEVSFAPHCPSGAFGICRNAQVSNQPYRQDIHYYGVASDTRYLKPFCEGQSQGTWE
ncbi:NADH:ubiquinone oxidoreductase [Pseudomonas boanensis]|uniref:NADH:ubiquinone oxidoreductase n=1 Tax=Metapseudomonas boanensis TaxID=2822138 RepID=UPI0035D3DF7D